MRDRARSRDSQTRMARPRAWRGAALAALVLLGCASAAAAAATDPYPGFSTFCRDQFGGTREPLIHRYAGERLRFEAEADWRHVSVTSARIVFGTNLLADGRVEYGTSTAYGSASGPAERRFHLHTCQLTGLLPSTTYQYRLVAVDERGETVRSENRSFTTGAWAGKVRVPEDMTGGPPYRLDRAGATYVLTRDVVADRLAFDLVSGTGMTLDLNGHTVTYNQVRVDTAIEYTIWQDWVENQKSVFGVRAFNYGGIAGFRVLNGTIRQGAGNNGGQENGNGFSPIYGRGSRGEVAGITVHYAGEQTKGLDLQQTDCVVHHNVIVDHGTDLTNRHQGVDAIGRGPLAIHHNLVKRARHRGISGDTGSDIHANELWLDSYATNSFGVFYYEEADAVCRGNRIYGTGYHVLGVGTMSRSRNLRVRGNFIDLRATAPVARFGEYGAQSSAVGVRITWGPDDILYEDNVIAVHGRDGGMVRGVWFASDSGVERTVFRRNVVKALTSTPTDPLYGAVSICGTADGAELPMTFEDNEIISDVAHLLLGGDYYDPGSHSRFRRNHFVRVGARADYQLIRIGHYGAQTSTDHLLVDSRFTGDTGYGRCTFHGTGTRDFSVGWTLTVRTTPGASVTIADSTGAVVFRGMADSTGAAATELIQYRRTAAGTTSRTPHTVTVTSGSATATRTPTVDRTMTLDIALGSTPPPPPTPTTTGATTGSAGGGSSSGGMAGGGSSSSGCGLGSAIGLLCAAVTLVRRSRASIGSGVR